MNEKNMNFQKRIENEKKFVNWKEDLKGNRAYFLEVSGKYGWKAKYIKEVDSEENTKRFYQEIYNELNVLVEIHEKYPVDKGHRKV
jgi:hypothetical protein